MNVAGYNSHHSHGVTDLFYICGLNDGVSLRNEFRRRNERISFRFLLSVSYGMGRECWRIMIDYIGPPETMSVFGWIIKLIPNLDYGGDCRDHY